VGVGVLGDAPALDLLDPLDRLHIQALLVVDEAARVRAGDHLAAELVDLLDEVDGHAAGAGDDAGLALEGLIEGPQHLLHEVGATVTR
jgi:hypothetical protein